MELSYLTETEQQDLLEIMESEDCTPSHAKAIKMRQFSQEGRLDANVLLSIMQEEKPNQVEQFKIPRERISKFFSPGTPAKKMEGYHCESTGTVPQASYLSQKYALEDMVLKKYPEAITR